MGGDWVHFPIAATFSANPRSIGTVAPRDGPPEFVAEVFVRAGFPRARPGGEVITCALACDPVRALELGLLEKREYSSFSTEGATVKIVSHN